MNVFEITIHDVETNTIITREMNLSELAQRAADLDAIKLINEAAKEKAAAKAALLERLGITADEAALLLG